MLLLALMFAALAGPSPSTRRRPFRMPQDRSRIQRRDVKTFNIASLRLCVGTKWVWQYFQDDVSVIQL